MAPASSPATDAPRAGVRPRPGSESAPASVEVRRFAARVLQRVESLASHPTLGGWVIEDESRRYRELLQGSYRIIYRATDEMVFIVAVRHAARLLLIDELN